MKTIVAGLFLASLVLVTGRGSAGAVSCSTPDLSSGAPGGGDCSLTCAVGSTAYVHTDGIDSGVFLYCNGGSPTAYCRTAAETVDSLTNLLQCSGSGAVPESGTATTLDCQCISGVGLLGLEPVGVVIGAACSC
jgi:hypothetical protein